MATAKKTTKKRTTAKKTTRSRSATARTGGSPALAEAAVSGVSPCSEEARGGEILLNVFVRRDQRLQSFFQVCASPAFLRIALFLDAPGVSGGTLLFEQNVGGQGQLNPVVLDIGPLPPGRYILQWGYAVVAEWQIAAEVWVDGVPRFRKLNAHDDTIPSNNVFAIIEVL